MLEARKSPMASDDDIQSAIEPSGAGPPKAQAFLLRHLFFPSYCWLTSWKRASAVFQAEGKRLLHLTKALPGDVLGQRVLIGPLVGIEDNSRNWSAEMVLEHLIEAGSVFAEFMVELSNGEKPQIKMDVAAVKPEGGKGIHILEDYKHFLEDYAETLSEDIGDMRSTLTHPHPWLGELTAHRWHCLAAVHQTVHRRQMERLIAGLGVAELRG